MLTVLFLCTLRTESTKQFYEFLEYQSSNTLSNTSSSGWVKFLSFISELSSNLQQKVGMWEILMKALITGFIVNSCRSDPPVVDARSKYVVQYLFFSKAYIQGERHIFIQTGFYSRI